MYNLKKRNTTITKLLNDSNVSTKIYFYFSRQTAGDDFDPYEKNYTEVFLAPRVIKGYVSDVKPEALVWKQYGLKEMGAKEILCDSKYSDYFRNARKIEIEGDQYVTYKEGMPRAALITKRPFKLIRVVLFKKG